FKAEDISKCLYKIWNDSVRPRHFLDANNENEIEAILSNREVIPYMNLLMVMSHSDLL
ncbi:3096_t:CDS:1, partial [Funneliformis geosporum]